jgi:hypothetical protein
MFEILTILWALKSLGVEKSYVSFVGDLCEIFCWDIYAKDAHEIDVHPLDNLDSNHVNDIEFIIDSARKTSVNPVSKNFLFNLAQHVKTGSIEIKIEKEGLTLKILDENLARSLIKYPYYHELYLKIRKFVKYYGYRLKECMNQANDIAKRSMTCGNLVYLVRKEKNMIVNSIKQILSKFIGIKAFVDAVVDTLLEKIKNGLYPPHKPYFNENYQQFLLRAYSSKSYPVRLAGICEDVREEENKIVLYVLGDGGCRIYTFKDCYQIPDYKNLRGKILTIEGIPVLDAGLPVCVALKIIERKDPSKSIFQT